ncbi:MAG: BamA/TamA family outer membrane protein [Bacteroidales bacterium]|nr:BamA/TamA family outer membrane protein [Bacteroidales bacterium]
MKKGLKKIVYFPIFLSLFLMVGCGSIRRYIPEGEHLLYKNQLDVQMTDGSEVTPEVQDALKFSHTYFKQKPNVKVLGIDKLRVGMTVYGWASPKDSTLWGNYLRRLGHAPVIYDEGRARQTATQLAGLLREKGCFNSTVTFDTAAIDGKDLTVCYHVRASQRYIVDEVVYRTGNNDIAKLLRQWEPESLVKAGEPYDQDKLTAERSRIVANLREEGYYHATTDLVTFLVDTTYDSRRLSIDIIVDGSKLKVYHINNVYIYPGGMGGQNLDTLIYTYPGIRRNIDYQFVYSGKMPFRPQTISRAMMLFPAMTYRPRYITNTYNSLLSLRNFKYINIEFSESPSSTDSLPLVDAHVRLVRATQQKISLSAELTNASPLGSDDSTGTSFISGGNLGIEAAVEYQHKNLFGGAEQLKIKYTQLMELPKFIFSGSGGGFYDNFSAFESGIDISMDVPMFLLPFASGIAWQRSRPHTAFSLGGSYQYRYYYERILANVSFGYNWRSSRRPIQHQLLPIDLTFVRVLNINDAFAARLQSMNDLRLKYQYSNHFIFGTRYDFTYSGQKFGTRQDFTVARLSAESAGNLLAATAGLLGATTDSNGVQHILGSPYAQYVRLGGELTYYHYIFNRSTLVTRIMLGAGIPYGNSVAMPYEKSFFGGGPTTLRAWQLRHLGPGSYNSGATILERVGDLQLVANIEGRFPIVSILEGAVFADMGNVWLLNPSDQYPGGELRWEHVLEEIAVGLGFGLRLNVSIATLRVDFGIPLYDPGYDTELRWRPGHWKFNQIVTNIGINYPF